MTEAFYERWHRAKWYWANLFFEWVFLSGLVLLLLWPVLNRVGAARWAAHYAAAPILFMLPVYLGYATFTFTSAGPSGGVLYPFLISRIHGGTFTRFDEQILPFVPQILEPLSTPIGPPMALTGMGMPGPVTMVSAGLLLGIIVFIVRLVQRMRSRVVAEVNSSWTFDACDSDEN